LCGSVDTLHLTAPDAIAQGDHPREQLAIAIATAEPATA
jgi:hypothetical protein